MKLAQFYGLLLTHDWFFHISEDAGARMEGRESLSRIRTASSTSETHRKLFDEYEQHMNSGPAFDTDRLPKPQLPANHYFTFGFGQVHQNCFHIITTPSPRVARELMVAKFGSKWSMQYSESEWFDSAGQSQQERYGLHEIK
jgi:hypothetical protein